MLEVEKFLGEIGLNRFEVLTYLELLKLGEEPASNVSKITKIPRSTVRGILDRLCEKGLVAKIHKRNTQYYSANDPKNIEKFLWDKISKTQNNLENFKKFNPFLDNLFLNKQIIPQVRYYEGPEQVIEAFNKCLSEDIDELLIFTSYHFLQNPLIRDNDDNFFVGQRVRAGINARVLVGKTTESRKMIQKSPKELRERRFIPEKYELPGNIHIYGNSVMYFSASDDEYMAVLIESSMMAQTMRNLFEFMWENV